MGRVPDAGLRLEWDTTLKRLATILSAGAALISIFTFLLGRFTSTGNSVAAAVGLASQVDRVELTPKADTAYALGDTLRLTALVADARGIAMLAAQVHWLSDDSSIVGVDSAGRVVARGPGITSVTVAAGGRAARARVWVLPRIAQLTIEGDSVIRIPEGESRRLHAVAWDARGNRIAAGGFGWTAADRGVATVDSTGEIHAVAPGSTTVSSATAGLLAQRAVEVVPVINSITLTAGADQRAAAGQRLPARVAVQVVSKSGRPVPGVLVRFDASQAGGWAEPDSDLTDSKGSARAAWTLGTLPGRQRLGVLVAAIDSPLVVSAEADPTPRNTRIALLSETLAGEVGTKLAAPVRVQVTDSVGAALADVPVTWSALDGGSFTAVDARTDTLGMARAFWSFGPRTGKQRAAVQVGNPRALPPFRLSGVASPAPAAAIRILSGNSQRGAVGSLLPVAIVLQTVDSFGNPVSEVPMRLAPSAGTVGDSVLRTGAGGKATVRWTLGSAADSARLAALLDGSSTGVEVTAIARPGPVATVAFVGAPTVGTAGAALAKPIQVLVADRFGNGVPQAEVSFAPGTGRVSPLHATTDAHGAAATRWTLGPVAGKQTLTVLIARSPARAALTLNAGPAKSAKPAPPPPTSKPKTPPKPARPLSPLGTPTP